MIHFWVFLDYFIFVTCLTIFCFVGSTGATVVEMMAAAAPKYGALVGTSAIGALQMASIQVVSPPTVSPPTGINVGLLKKESLEDVDELDDMDDCVRWRRGNRMETGSLDL